MTVLVNGKVTTQVSVNDRGLLYGQSLFETIAVVNAQPQLLEAHLDRLTLGAKKLEIVFNINDLINDIKVISRGFSPTFSGVLRIAITMGVGGRGYANPESPSATRILSLHDYPTYSQQLSQRGITVGLSSVKLGHQPLLAGLKHANRLEQTLARAQWQAGWNEALICDCDDNVIEGTQSNIIVLKEKQAFTPLLDKCGVEGVMKAWVLEQLKDAGFSCHAVRLSLQDIEQADEILLTNSLIGVWPVKTFHSKTHTYTYETGYTPNKQASDQLGDKADELPTAQRLIKRLQEHEIIPNH